MVIRMYVLNLRGVISGIDYTANAAGNKKIAK